MFRPSEATEGTPREHWVRPNGGSCASSATALDRQSAVAAIVGILSAAAFAASCSAPAGAPPAEVPEVHEMQPLDTGPAAGSVLPWLVDEEWERLGLLVLHSVSRSWLVRWCGWPIRSVPLDQRPETGLVYGPGAVVTLIYSRGNWRTWEHWIAPMYGEIVDCTSGPQGTVAAVIRYPHPATVGYRFPPEIDAGQMGFGGSAPGTCWDVVGGVSHRLLGDGNVGLRLASLLTDPLRVEPRLESVSDRKLVLSRENGLHSSIPMMRAAQLAEDWPTFTPTWGP